MEHVWHYEHPGTFFINPIVSTTSGFKKHDIFIANLHDGGTVVTENIVRWISEFYGHGRQYQLDYTKLHLRSVRVHNSPHSI